MAFFDSRVPLLLHNAADPGAFRTFYAQQAAALQSRLAGVPVILDVGCGPMLPYRRPAGTRLVLGLDNSRPSLEANKAVDVRLHGSATAIPLPARSVDAIVCFYSLHHFVGPTTRATRQIVRVAVTEFARVLGPDGHLIVIEVAPWWPLPVAQRIGWMLRAWPMRFWTRRALTRLVGETLTRRATLEVLRFRVPGGTVIPPAFAWPWLRVPRALYPFSLLLYHWRLA